jgi:hypothetical protein
MTGVSFALFANDMTGENLAGFRPPFSGNHIQKLLADRFYNDF